MKPRDLSAIAEQLGVSEAGLRNLLHALADPGHRIKSGPSAMALSRMGYTYTPVPNRLPVVATEAGLALARRARDLGA